VPGVARLSGCAAGKFAAFLLIACILAGGSAQAALPGVVEFGDRPESLADAELDAVLAKRVAGADVIAIGETIHGSAGLLRVQTRLIRYLVSRHGLRLIAWENPPLRSLELAHWLASCGKTQSTPPLDALYMPTVADRELWEWLCEYNRANPADPLLFRGIDVWDRPWAHYERIDRIAPGIGLSAAVAGRIRNRCPGYGARSWEELDQRLPKPRQGPRFLPENHFEECRTALTQLMDAARVAAEAARKSGGQGAATDAYEVALAASTLLGWLGFYHLEQADDVLSWNERDRAQGRNLLLVMEMHGVKRALLAAHTSHVSHNRSPADWWGYGDLKSGVHFFSRLSGKRVFNIALTAYRASGTQGELMLPTAENSIDRRLHEAGHRFAFFSAGAEFLAEHPRWWMQNGNAAGVENGVEIVPRDHFDAYFFLEHSLLEGALPARSLWRP
jgi:erythromycin esterase-like protein